MNKNGKNGNGEATISHSSQLLAALDDIDLKILQVRTDRPGAGYKELEEATGLSRWAIWDRTKKPAYKAAIAQSRQDAIDMIENAKRRAAERLIELMEGRIDTSTAARAATAILADLLPARKVDISGLVGHVHFNAQVAEEELIDKIERISGGNMKEQRN